MKLLLTSAEFLPFRGGVAEVVHGLASGLSVEGFAVTVLTRGNRARIQSQSIAYRVVSYPFHLGWRPEFEILTVALRLSLESLRIPTLLAADYVTQRALSLLPLACPVRRRAWLCAYGSEVLAHGTIGRVSRRKSLFAECCGVIAISEYAAGLVKHFFPNAKVTVIYPGIREELFTTPKDVRRVAEIRRTVRNQTLILCVGRLDPRKGQDTLIRALPKLLSQGLRPYVAFLGDGPYRSHLEELASGGGVKEQIRFLGNVSDGEKIVWLDAADIMVQPSRQEGLMVEGLGLALAEAGARGKVVLASRHGGIPEVIQDGVTGVLVEEGAPPEQWAQAIAELASAPERRRELGTAARDHVAGRFRWALAASAAASLIRSHGIGGRCDD